MKDKHKQGKLFDAKLFENYVRTWKSVKLKKELKLKTVPPSFRDFVEWLDDGIFEVLDVKQGNTINLCLCKQDPHTEDCLTWPHLSVIVEDLEGNIRPIHSLWLEPVEFLSPMEKVKELIEIVESMPEDLTDIKEELQNKPGEEPLIEIAQEQINKKYSFVVLLADGTVVVEDPENSVNPDFAFDSKTGQWLFTDCVEEEGALRHFKNSTAVAMVIEADSDQLRLLVQTFLEILSDAVGEKILKALK